jgi:hypothetical protein
MTRRIALLTSLLVLALAVPANAQQNPFGPLPSADTPVPTATPVSTSSDNETGSRTLFIIGGALILGFGIMGYLIMRDARNTVPEIELAHDIHREEAVHKRQKQDKAKARKRTRAQKHARKAQRPR